MVSKASEDLPEPETPVTTVSRPTGMEKEIFLRLLTRAPRTSMASSIMVTKRLPRHTAEISGGAANSHDNLISLEGETQRTDRRLINHKGTKALALSASGGGPSQGVCTVASTPRCTPAMEAGITGHVWELKELLA